LIPPSKGPHILEKTAPFCNGFPPEASSLITEMGLFCRKSRRAKVRLNRMETGEPVLRRIQTTDTISSPWRRWIRTFHGIRDAFPLIFRAMVFFNIFLVYEEKKG